LAKSVQKLRDVPGLPVQPDNRSLFSLENPPNFDVSRGLRDTAPDTDKHSSFTAEFARFFSWFGEHSRDSAEQ